MRAPILIAGLVTVVALTMASTHAATTTLALLNKQLSVLDKTLTPEQKAKLYLPFDEERTGFNFLPGDRRGLTLKDMTPEQQALTRGICKVMLSQRGLEKVTAIQAREALLHTMENNNPVRDPEKYTLAVFGTPDPKTPWSLRWEGHHLSLNWTIVNGDIVSSSPQFLGTNPGEVMEGEHKGDRPLAAEEDMARALLKSLDDNQRVACILSAEAPADVITRLDRQAQVQEDKGIAYTALSEEQRTMLEVLIAEHATIQNPDLATERITRLQAAGMDTIKFAWMGGMERGQGHYYRIQGKTFIIEYDNTQNNANHAHVVWRDFAGDFGRDALAEHYKTEEHAK